MTTTYQRQTGADAFYSHLGGIFYLNQVASYLKATLPTESAKTVSLSGAKIRGWARRGFFVFESDEYEGNRTFVRFPDLVTSRKIALLLSLGVPIARIRRAHGFFADRMNTKYPFARLEFWSETPQQSRHVYSSLDDVIVAGDLHAQLPFEQLLHGTIQDEANMSFGGDENAQAESWNPAPQVQIDPLVQSGDPCIQGTRTPTSIINACLNSGLDAEAVASLYRLTVRQVFAAQKWEQELERVA